MKFLPISRRSQKLLIIEILAQWSGIAGGGDADPHQYPLLLGNETRSGFTITYRGHFATVCTLINVKSDEHLKMKFVGLGSAQ